MKIRLELVTHEEPDGRKFLNYWDYMHGDDVCCQIINNKLMLFNHDDHGNDLPLTEISLSDFIELVKDKIYG